MIRVLVADDHAAFREGVRYLLEQQGDIEVVGEASTGVQATQLSAELRPDVAIIEPLMAGALDAVREVCRQDPSPSVIVLSARPDHDRVLSAARAGALSYVAKDAEPEEMLRVVRAAAVGVSTLDARFAVALEQAKARYGHLTPRELEVLIRIARGQSNREIAADLGLSEETVKTHVAHLLAKLDVTDRTQASVFALRSGLVPLDPPRA